MPKTILEIGPVMITVYIVSDKVAANLEKGGRYLGVGYDAKGLKEAATERTA
jgi:hypothetical protein